MGKFNRAISTINYPREDLLEECDFNHEVLPVRSPIIEIIIFNTHFPALVDTGSEICCINEEVWLSLSPYHESITKFNCTGVKIAGAFKVKQRRVKMQAYLIFKIGNKTFSHEFLVIPDLSCKVIIGSDFLRRVQAKIDLGAEKVIFMDGKKNS